VSGLTIERLSEASGLDEDRIREYQRQGLLPGPTPTPGGSEEYPEETLAQLPLIHRARDGTPPVWWTPR
jgi:DNA-binding transcriptional MerR regulator